MYMHPGSSPHVDPYTHGNNMTMAPTMALNGSNFGAASSLEYSPYDEKDHLSSPSNPGPDNAVAGGAPPYDAYDAYDGYHAHAHPHPQTSPSPYHLASGASGAHSARTASHGSTGYDTYGNPTSDNYASFPPPVGMQMAPGMGGPGVGMGYESDSDGHGQGQGQGGQGQGQGQGQYGMGQVGGPVTFQSR